MSERWSKKRIKEVNAEMADQILIEIGLTLEEFECAHGQGTHTAQLTPSMFYPEWIACIAAKSNARIAELEAENARLREFVRSVLYDYLEVDKQTQCPWCLWVPGRSHNPIHECDAVDMMKLVGLRAALQEGSDED